MNNPLTFSEQYVNALSAVCGGLFTDAYGNSQFTTKRIAKVSGLTLLTSLPLYVTAIIAHIIARSGTYQCDSTVYVSVLGFGCFLMLIGACAMSGFDNGRIAARNARFTAELFRKG